MSVADIRKRTLPIVLFLPLIIFCFVFRLGAFSTPGYAYWLTALVFGGIFAVFAAFGKCGGGDAIMAVTLGLCAGFEQMLLTVTAASISMVLWHSALIASSKLRHRTVKTSAKITYPYAPFILLGYCIAQVAKYSR
jgi:prepilin signal peptidase PulO-like enzyme (type II secretory pathway)